MSDTPGVPPQPGSAQLERLQQLDRRIAQTVGQLIGSLQDEVDRRLNEATGELQRLFEKMKPSAPNLPGAFLQPEDLSDFMPDAPEPAAAPAPVRASLNESLAPLLAGLARIDGESGQAPILKALLEESARFSSRAAFLLIRGGEIRGWAARDLPEGSLQQTNFATLGGAFTRLLSADGTVVLAAGECAEVATMLGVEPGWSGVLVPFQIRGQLAGALYADRLEEEELAVAALQVLAYGAAQALETSQLRKGSASALRLGAGEQLPETPEAHLPEVTAPVPLVADPASTSWSAPAEEPADETTEASAYAGGFAAEPEGAEPEAEAGQASGYEATSHEAASYEAPAAYETPSYETPSYETPSYEAPSYAASSYEAPTYEAPSYDASYPAPSHESFEAPATEAPATPDPAYGAGAFEPAYELPSYEPPTVKTPSYDDAYAAPSYEAPSYEAPSYEAPSYEAPTYAAPSYEPPAVEAPSYEISYDPAAYAAPAYEPAPYEPAPYEPPAESPAYDISYPSSFDIPAVEPAPYEPPAYEPAAYEPAAYEPATYDAPGAEPPAAGSYEPSFEMVPDEPPYAAAAYEAPYEPPAYQPAREPSSFDTSFEPAVSEAYGAPDDVRFAREPVYDLPSEEEIALEKQPEPALEDTNIWEAEEEDDEPTQIGQSTAAVPQVVSAQEASGAAPAPVGQQTVRLDISQLQSHATQLAQERYGDDTADVAPPASSWQAPPAAPAAYAPTYSPPSFAPAEPYAGVPPSYDQSEAPTMLGRPPQAPAAAAPPSPAGFAGPAATEQAPGGFGAGGFGGGEAKEAGGSTEVRPPADLVGPGLAFAAHSPGQRPSAASGVEETLREEARRLARLLVSEIKLYNEEIIEEGRRSGNIYDRLKDDIDRSRQMYEERIDPRLTDQEDYFYQELVQRLAGGDVKLLGL